MISIKRAPLVEEIKFDNALRIPLLRPGRDTTGGKKWRIKVDERIKERRNHHLPRES